ncbi:MAG: hypothetical protein WDO24_08590 [Pseudomonadota bacterium]
MTDRPSRARRRLLRSALALAALGMARRARAQDKAEPVPLEKVTREEVAYQDQPRNGVTCGMCSLFVAPHGCKVIDGEVSRYGWCKLFDMVD